MKKSIVALTGIVMIAAATILYSCNKEGNEIANGNVGTEVSQTKAKEMLEQPVQPHFTYRPTIQYGSCIAKTGYLCGFDLTVLTGDEACWLMMYMGDPYAFLLPKSYLLANNAGELIDSARTGTMTFHSDFEFLSDELVKLAGTDLIPAGRYPTVMTTHKGDSAVCIYLDTVL